MTSPVGSHRAVTFTDEVTVTSERLPPPALRERNSRADWPELRDYRLKVEIFQLGAKMVPLKTRRPKRPKHPKRAARENIESIVSHKEEEEGIVVDARVPLPDLLRCFFLGAVCSCVLALHTARATSDPVRVYCAAAMRSVSV
ncbi:hypothetical protein EYF80_032090 [Liparis tanakae]|uniref:Uncharacterized protein n=1 Tax=Liparis tanakae TaxID=230148 RepID=A0A4Z2GYI8_9TELE|nr:hypothetical protein EYF80_032090 [Liparis tanakae]